MRSFKTTVLIALLFCAFTSVAQNAPAPVDARWVISKSIEAMGGEALLRSIKTLHTEFSTQMEGRPVTWVTKEMLPNRGAFQIVYKGRVVYEDWFDGQKGFELVNGEAKAMDPQALADKYPRKNIFNELDFLDTALYKIQLLGDAKVGRMECYVVKATFVTGDVRHVYIDKKNFYSIRQDRFKPGETQASSVSFSSGFRKYGDLVFYSMFTMGEGRSAPTAKTTKLIINQGITEADFNRD